jgi:multidrug efflux system membrane fusion protein
MNIRIPNSFDDVSGTARTAPDRAKTASERAIGWGRVVRWALGLLILAVLAWAIYVSLAPAKKPKTPPAPVLVTKVVQNDLPVVEHQIGTVVSNATVQVTARVTGELLKAYFTEGQMVHKGDLLFQIDPGPYQAAYNNAAATLATAKVKAERYAALMAQKAVAPQDADDAKAAYLVAQANVDAAKLNLSYTQIRSPINGKTGALLIQPGNQITAGGSSSTGPTTAATTNAALVTITQVTPIKISFSLPQTDLPAIQRRMGAQQAMPVTLTPQGDTTPLTATVDFVGNQVSDATGTIELRATFGNQSNTLVPGQIVDVGVTLDALKGVLVVPHDAINLGPSSSFVYVVKNGNAVMVPVQVLHDDATNAAIKGAIKPGDTVIVDGQLKVIPGKPVHITGQGKGKPGGGAPTGGAK